MAGQVQFIRCRLGLNVDTILSKFGRPKLGLVSKAALSYDIVSHTVDLAEQLWSSLTICLAALAYYNMSLSPCCCGNARLSVRDVTITLLLFK